MKYMEMSVAELSKSGQARMSAFVEKVDAGLSCNGEWSGLAILREKQIRAKINRAPYGLGNPSIELSCAFANVKVDLAHNGDERHLQLAYLFEKLF